MPKAVLSDCRCVRWRYRAREGSVHRAARGPMLTDVSPVGTRRRYVRQLTSDQKKLAPAVAIVGIFFCRAVAVNPSCGTGCAVPATQAGVVAKKALVSPVGTRPRRQLAGSSRWDCVRGGSFPSVHAHILLTAAVSDVSQAGRLFRNRCEVRARSIR
jgi:hypothetical protein